MVNLTGMSFLWPAMLLLLGVIPLGIVIYIILQQKRRIRAGLVANGPISYGSFSLVQGAARAEPGLRRHIPPALFLLSLTILIIALARPQASVRLPQVQGTVIMAFDVSGSMAADDMGPSRMEAAKAAARDFVQRQPRNVQIGVVAFSTGGFAVQVPTNDQEAILASIERLKPEQSTALAHGIYASLDAISRQAGQPSPPDNNLSPTTTPTPVPQGSYAPAVIVLLTDGENTAPPEPFSAAQLAAERGVRIYTIGVGSAAGKTLQINGFNIHTQLDEQTLEQISQITGGTYYHAENEEDLNMIYDDIDPQLVIKPEKMEITSLLAGASILILLIGSAFSLLWFNHLP